MFIPVFFIRYSVLLEGRSTHFAPTSSRAAAAAVTQATAMSVTLTAAADAAAKALETANNTSTNLIQAAEKEGGTQKALQQSFDPVRNAYETLTGTDKAALSAAATQGQPADGRQRPKAVDKSDDATLRVDFRRCFRLRGRLVLHGGTDRD